MTRKITGNEMLALVFVFVLASFAVQYEMTLKMKSLASPRKYYSLHSHQRLNNNNINNNNKLNGWKGEGSTNTKQTPTIDIRKLDLFMKHLTLAHRFERNTTLRQIMTRTAKQIARFNNGQSTATTTKMAPQKRPRLSVTVILNAVNEISEVGTLLQGLAYNKTNKKRNIDYNDDWRLETKILLGITQTKYDIHSKAINNLLSRTFAYAIVPPEKQNLVVNTLAFLVEKVSTENVLLARNIRSIARDFNIDEFIRPLQQLQQQQHNKKNTTKNSIDVVIASQILPGGSRWSTGCYQSKLIWNQFKTQYGTDSIDVMETYSNSHTISKKNADQLWVRCDFFSGPFSMRRDVLVGLLSNQVKSRCRNDVIYTEIAYAMNNKKESVMKLHPSTIFHMGGDSGGGRALVKIARGDWLNFAARNDISEIIIDSLETKTDREHSGQFVDNKVTETKIHHEFDRSTLQKYGTETNTDNCNANNTNNIKSNMLQPRHCIRDKHQVLINTLLLFNKFGLSYNSEGSLALAAVKTHDTMPWYSHHELAFRTDNAKDLIKRVSEFKKYGLHLEQEPVGNSIKVVSSALWNITLHAKQVLPGDFYKSSKVLNRHKQSFPNSRILASDTKVRMGNLWIFSNPNPGYYARAQYGMNVLKHTEKHGSVSTDLYGNITRRFRPCPVEGHQRCMNQYLSDGNIQFQRVWA